MKKTISMLFAVVIALYLFAYYFLPKLNSPDVEMKEIFIGNAKMQVELADTPEKMALGLSGRKSLDENNGMLFVFEEPDFHSFWMRGMKFPIDIIWFDENRKVVDYMKNTPPDSYPTAFKPESRAKYVLETNSGWADTNNIKIGDTLIIR